MDGQTQDARATRYGWMMVAIAPIFLGMGSGGLVSISVFLKPLAAEFGWQRGDITTAYLAATLASGLCGIALGYLADRFRTRPVVWLGAGALGLTYLLLSRQTALWQFMVYSALLGGLGNAAFFAPLAANVGNWFDRNKGLALGITTAGHALGQGLVVLAAWHLIDRLGWRQAYAVLGITAWAVLVPLAVLVRDAPRSAAPAVRPGTGARPDAPPLPARTLVAWLGAAMLLCCICMAMPTVHLVALASDTGVPAADAAGVMVVLMGAGCVGRIAFGRIADRVGGVRAYWIASAVQTLTVFWFTQLGALPAFYALALLFGVASSGMMTSVLHCVRELVPQHRRALAVGTVTLFGSLGMGLGGLQGGYLFDLTGTYVWPFGVAALAGAGNLLVVGALQWRLYGPVRAARPAPAVPALASGRLGVA